MRLAVRGFAVLLVLVAGAASIPAFWPGLYWSAPRVPENFGPGDPVRGEQVFAIGGCASCHTGEENDAQPLAGGRRLETPFGVFVAPNITPDPETGIGNWSDADFVRALTVGLSPDGRHYYPAFPYTSYTRMTLRDLVDLKAYLDTVPAVRNRTAGHDLDFPYGIRPGLGLWKFLFLDTGRFEPDPARPPELNRGAYLVRGPGHCGECHTPRNFAGAMRAEAYLAGAAEGPEGGRIPNITPHESGIGGWTESELADFLGIGITPDGDFAGAGMAEVIENGPSRLSAADRAAIVNYLRALPPRPFGGN